MFSCDFSEISENIFFKEHLRTTASVNNKTNEDNPKKETMIIKKVALTAGTENENLRFIILCLVKMVYALNLTIRCFLNLEYNMLTYL